MSGGQKIYRIEVKRRDGDIMPSRMTVGDNVDRIDEINGAGGRRFRVVSERGRHLEEFSESQVLALASSED